MTQRIPSLDEIEIDATFDKQHSIEVKGGRTLTVNCVAPYVFTYVLDGLFIDRDKAVSLLAAS